ncbi:Protein of unknown function [Pseudomonas libanensis]|uniref:DUF3077 domain-containing protein n=1 Tax=Pseudomonas libanensis TaxID=75588 RepID=UPI00087D7E0E|nr:Protein of unknown function [Pseudomonas libanensis]
MPNALSAETIGAATFADCGENKSPLKLFRVNAGVPLVEALKIKESGAIPANT